MECLRLFGAIVVSGLKSIPGFLQLAGLLPYRPKAYEPPAKHPSSSALVDCVDKAAADIQPQELLEHCYRTWLFGLALAKADGHNLDADHFYCAAMLHDYGLARPTPGRDFTHEGSERAISCAVAAGVPTSTAEEIGDAICVHATPGISIQRDGELGFYVRAGSIADISGIRLWDLRDTDVQDILSDHRRGPKFKQVLAEKMHAEARAVPRGRFALLVRTGAAAFIQRSIHGMRATK